MHLLRGVVVYCGVLQCVAVCRSMLTFVLNGLLSKCFRTFDSTKMSPERALRKVDSSNTTNTKTVILATGWRTPTGCRIFAGHFPQKSPRIGGSFANNDLQLENDLDAKVTYGSLPPYTRSWQVIGRQKSVGGEKPDVCRNALVIERISASCSIVLCLCVYVHVSVCVFVFVFSSVLVCVFMYIICMRERVCVMESVWLGVLVRLVGVYFCVWVRLYTQLYVFMRNGISHVGNKYIYT